MAEAQSMMDDGLKKMTKANAKMQAAEALEADASRSSHAAEQKLHEVEAREDDLRRQMNYFKSECDAKEKEILLERQSLAERHKFVQQSQERLLDGQALLNQDQDITQKENEFKKKYQELQIEQDKISSKESDQEWELIDEKREKLRLEAERIAEERVKNLKFLKDEPDVLKLEKDLFSDQYKKDVELVNAKPKLVNAKPK
nr:protein crowded nuclei 4-like [Tanacetum cinerariifolium]